MNEKICSNCGKPNPAEMNFCLDCGQSLAASGNAPNFPVDSAPTVFVSPNKQPNFQPLPLIHPPAAPKKSKSGIWLAVIGVIGLSFLLIFAGLIGLVVMNWDKIAKDNAQLRPINSNASFPTTPTPRSKRGTNINTALPDTTPAENHSVPPTFESDSNDTAPENNEPTPDDRETTSAPGAVFDNLRVDYDVIENGQTGMRIHTKFTVNNLKNVDSYLAIYFETREGKRLKDKNRKFFSADGDVAVYRSFKPAYDVAVYDDLTVFMPYNELDLKKGDYKLRMDADVIYKEGGMIQHLDFHDFDYTF